ncbi:MAG: GNAT family N-acetyltransferase [Anaerolineales bacterium]|nr:GNAT family N-acetyltransferase [Anaerolineales bacterium]MCA9928780.1 GNAT family N-acetyltransferase [Anaerolineales bacterium]
MLRKYQTEDLEDVLTVWATASAIAHPFLSTAFLAGERHNIATLYLPNSETWVWEAEGRAAGFISLLGNEVGGLFVDPALHRMGIGQALMDHARTLHGDLEVEVFKANLIGRRFYEKYGFVLMHELIHEETGQAALRLRLAA